MTPSTDSILGKYTAGEIILKTANPNLCFEADAKEVDGKDSFFQTALAGQPRHINSRSEGMLLPVFYWSRLS